MTYLVVALALGLAALLAPATGAAQPSVSEQEVRRVGSQLLCPVCEGQSVAESNAGLALEMREVIRAKLAEGQGERQILEFFVGAYGESILAEPPRRGVGLGVWLVPPLLLAGGLVALALVVRGWVRRRAPAPEAGAPPGTDLGVAEELARFRRAAG